MILSVQRAVHDAIAATIQRHFGLADVPAFAVEVPPTRTLGDLAVPVAFQLAKALRKAPKAIAELHVDFDGKEIWSHPGGYSGGPRDTYWTFAKPIEGE